MPRKMSYDFVTQHATDDRGMCVRDRAYFHYFNPNGAYAAKRASDDLVREAVNANRCKSGALIAYGSLNDYAAESLCGCIKRLIDGKRVRAFDVDYAARSLRRDAEKAREFLASL